MVLVPLYRLESCHCKPTPTKVAPVLAALIFVNPQGESSYNTTMVGLVRERRGRDRLVGVAAFQMMWKYWLKVLVDLEPISGVLKRD